MNTIPKNAKVIVGLSGGVDSAVAALMLLQAGHDVEAMHMTNWHDDDGYCSAADDLADARQVADLLRIPFHHVDFSAEYRDQVFADFLRDYEAGLTPNPDILCNREIKFGACLAYARRLGADLMATGHYARSTDIGGVTALQIPTDRHKDQTYFLHAVAADALASAVFPLADITKPEVRDLATQAGLPNRNKKDSTGICFIGERPFEDFLGQYLQPRSGPIETLDGQQVGSHRGAQFYTVGQRKGLGIGGVRQASDEPWFVVDRDVESNVVRVVQGKQHPALYRRALVGDQVHWISPPADYGGGFQARIRHGQPLADCTVAMLPDGHLAVQFDIPQWAVAAGQYVVIYRDDYCLGGARILPAAGSEAATALRA